MSNEIVKLLVYCDGSVEHGIHGVQYNRPPRTCLRISRSTRYVELQERLSMVLKIELYRYTLRLMWRSPSLHQRYVLHPIEGDEDVDDMLSLPLKNPECGYIELYVSKEDAPEPSNAEDPGPALHTSHAVQAQLNNSITVGTVAGASNDHITDGFGFDSDESADDDEEWPDHEDSDEDGEDDDEPLRDDIVNRPGCSSTVGSGIPKNVPTEMHVPAFYHHLDLDDGGCVSTREDLPFYSQFWDSSMTEFAKGMLFTNKKDLKRACDIITLISIAVIMCWNRRRYYGMSNVRHQATAPRVVNGGCKQLS